jgi:DNA helicase HerA-like ATPase
MYKNNKLVIGKNGDNELCILPKMANRHGIITGASGSGKTTTVKVMAESFSSAGIPVFYVDVKGDLASICKQGEPNENVDKRVVSLKLDDFSYQSFPVTFFDVFKKNGHPIRTTIENIGPRLLSIMLELSDAQEGVLAIVFQIAKDENMPLIDLGDLKSLLLYVGENKDKYITKYGNITTQSVGAIQRNILILEQEGGVDFFGKPELQLFDLMQFDYNGKGFVNVLDAQELFKKPTLYAVFLVWMLNNLYDNLPEVGDLERPKLALFLDEAHLIFSEMSPSVTKQIVQVVKLIRSKGVGVYFISQSPSDVPDEILSQLGNKVQHVLRSYTPSDDKAIKAAANSFRTNPKFKTEDAIRELATGEALVSFLDEKGEPSVVERCWILPPQSFMGTISDELRDSLIKSSRIFGKYETELNEVSATEKVDEENAKIAEEKKRIEEEKLAAQRAKEEEKQRIAAEKQAEKEAKEKARLEKEAQRQKEKEEKEAEKKRKQNTKIFRQLGNKVVNKATTKAVNTLWKGIFK